jgi:hypothetical protein
MGKGYHTMNFYTLMSKLGDNGEVIHTVFLGHNADLIIADYDARHKIYDLVSDALNLHIPEHDDMGRTFGEVLYMGAIMHSGRINLVSENGIVKNFTIDFTPKQGDTCLQVYYNGMLHVSTFKN